MRRYLLAAIVWAACSGVPCWAINGSALPLNSSGDTFGSAAELAGTGYVGT